MECIADIMGSANPADADSLAACFRGLRASGFVGARFLSRKNEDQDIACGCFAKARFCGQELADEHLGSSMLASMDYSVRELIHIKAALSKST